MFQGREERTCRRSSLDLECSLGKKVSIRPEQEQGRIPAYLALTDPCLTDPLWPPDKDFQQLGKMQQGLFIG
jgi:hypothetical protein